MVQHNTDALWPRTRLLWLNRRLLRSTPRWFDVFLTTNIDDRARIERRSVTVSMLTDLGYDEGRFEPSPLPLEIQTQWANPMIFIGHYEPRTEAGILALIEAGLPVTVFGHPRELVEKARYYLEHDEERQEIARNGRERCEASGYSWRAIMKRDWSKVMEIYRQRRPGMSAA